LENRRVKQVLPGEVDNSGRERRWDKAAGR
jgi:hypothetical protein